MRRKTVTTNKRTANRRYFTYTIQFLDNIIIKRHLVSIKWARWNVNGLFFWRLKPFRRKTDSFFLEIPKPNRQWTEFLYMIMSWHIIHSKKKRKKFEHTDTCKRTNTETHFHERIIWMRLLIPTHYTNKICIQPFYWHLIRYVTRLMNYINIIITHWV